LGWSGVLSLRSEFLTHDYTLEHFSSTKRHTKNYLAKLRSEQKLPCCGDLRPNGFAENLLEPGRNKNDALKIKFNRLGKY